MKLEVLLSTMNLKNEQENIELIKKMNIKSNSLTINQITDDNIKEFNNVKNETRIISKKEKGLSKSRNLAIANSKAEICILADDDLVYKKGFEDIIKQAYKKYNNYDILCFYVESNNVRRKVKRLYTFKVGKISAMRICSVQITFKKDSIIQNNISFDKNFGAGTYYDRGEETIFLWECLKKGLKIKFINKKIADVNQKQSEWFNEYNEDFFEKQGVVFYRLSPKMYKLLILQYAIRKYRLYNNNLKFIQAIKVMKNGIEKYKELK